MAALSFVQRFRLTTHLRHRDELRVGLILLGDVGQPTEDQHAHDDHQHQQTKLFVTEIRSESESESESFLSVLRVDVYGRLVAVGAKAG